MANRMLVGASVCILLAIAAPSSFAKEPPRNRRAFAKAMGKVKVGMSEAQVLALVGKPDDVSTPKDWDLDLAHIREVWRYGTAGRMEAATLGEIGVDVDQKVEFVAGGGAPPPDGMFTDGELRKLLEALNDLPGQDGIRYNPRPVIRAVNLLQPLGKERALAAVDEFLRVSSEYTAQSSREGLFLVLRTLFEVPNVPTVFPSFYPDDTKLSPPGYMPPLYGLPSPAEPDDKTLLPRFPIVIEGDIPLLIRRWGGSTGPPQMPSSHVAYFRKFGTLRAKPLMPTAKPFEALEAFIKSPRWWLRFESDRPARNDEERREDKRKRDQDQQQRIALREELLRLLDTVNRIEPNESGGFLSWGSCDAQTDKLAEAANSKIVSPASKLAIRWDDKNFRYTLLDGTFVPPFDPKLHPAQAWAPSVSDLKLELIFRRQSRRYVEVSGRDLSGEGSRNPEATIRVFDVKAEQKPLFESHEMRNGWLSTVELDERTGIQVEVVVGKESQRSPVFKP